MLVDAYGSDNSDGSGDESAPQSTSTSQNKPNTSLSRSLPVPSNPSASKSSTLSLPAPKAKKPPKKVAIELPALTKDVSSDYDENEARPAKRLRTEGRGAGSSALLSMLPAPKLAAPVKEAPERILGSGKGPGLVFKEPYFQRTKDIPSLPSFDNVAAVERETEEVHLPFMPASVRKGKANISLEEPSERVTSNTRGPPSPTTLDLFSLSSSHHINPAKPPSSSVTTSTGRPNSLSISSAPKIDEYTPPEPTPNDPYPGYYQLPSGTWTAYDSAYYQRFYDKWKADYDREIRAIEKKEKGFEGADTGETQEVDALREMEKAKKEIQEREEKKALTKGAGGEPEAPRMNVKGSKISKGARKRGQLASLLVEAYQNREVLEERIAEGRRNRKEAGNKYGAFHSTLACLHAPSHTSWRFLIS
ncbi:mitotic checkpoint regulator, MAD2B-interacting-domain-containing protein [Lactarius pseudohatsudake]|nr:mitotic checkpoint regulator, MAD2B-interacting-domain-containing protein [Lactarius pseudohatsudake]